MVCIKGFIVRGNRQDIKFFQTSRRSAGANAVIVLYSPGNARLKSSNRTSAKSLATSFKERPSSGMLKALHTVRIFSSPKLGYPIDR